MTNSLGFNKKPEETRVVVAMSGGVDSSVVAARLKDEKYDVIGITLQLYDHGQAIGKKGACCAGLDINDASNALENTYCSKLGTPKEEAPTNQTVSPIQESPVEDSETEEDSSSESDSDSDFSDE